jgi:hypothetical protein
MCVWFFAMAQTTFAQQGVVERYFDETKQRVSQPFLGYFDKFGGIAVFGYPISQEFIDPKTKIRMQYFQRARLEYHPQNPPRYQIQPGLIGDELGYGQARVTPNSVPYANKPTCKYFIETGHYVCDAFLDFFKANGNLEVFGYPIAESRIERDRIVQEFQRLRLEWYPEYGFGQKVQIAPLGLPSFYERGYSLVVLGPSDSTTILTPQPPAVTQLNVTINLANPVIGGGMLDQTLYVVVTDQTNSFLRGALITGILRNYLATPQSFRFESPTNNKGVAQYTIKVPVTAFKPGEYIFIEIIATYGNLTNSTRTSFLAWW